MAHGGKRKGAGRKPADDAGPGVRVTYRVPPDVDARIRQLAAERKCSQGAIVSAAVRALAEPGDHGSTS